MRITRDLLHKFAQQTVTARLRSAPDIHAAYLIGSLTEDDPLLGGTTDIDLVLVHKYQIPLERECVPITPDVSLDIFHKIRDDYSDHRSFRQDPHMGYPLTHYNIILHDSEHWLEFIQSSITAEFHRPDNVLIRVRKLSSAAREKWFTLIQEEDQALEVWLDQYLEILSLAANSIAGLIGAPLTRRRFLKTLRERVELLGVQKVLAGFYGLLGYHDEKNNDLMHWIEVFESDISRLSEKSNPPTHLLPCRHQYYITGMKALANSDIPGHAIYPLLRTWLDVQLFLEKGQSNRGAWEEFLTSFDLSKEHITDKNEAVDAYLDSLDIIIETWERNYGI